MKKYVAALLPIALVFGCVGCGQGNSGTMNGVSSEEAESMVGHVDTPDDDELDEYMNSHVNKDSEKTTTESTSTNFSFHISF